MKSTGIVRKLDELGRVVIPKEIRRTNGWNETDPIEIYTDGNKVILTKYQPSCACVNCGEADNTVKMDNVRLCRNCATKIYREFLA